MSSFKNFTQEDFNEFQKEMTKIVEDYNSVYEEFNETISKTSKLIHTLKEKFAP
ncbi:hypothetical protein NUSPORA_00397 [Nucleospora cyclopteri]